MVKTNNKERDRKKERRRKSERESASEQEGYILNFRRPFLIPLWKGQKLGLSQVNKWNFKVNTDFTMIYEGAHIYGTNMHL